MADDPTQNPPDPKPEETLEEKPVEENPQPTPTEEPKPTEETPSETPPTPETPPSAEEQPKTPEPQPKNPPQSPQQPQSPKVEEPKPEEVKPPEEKPVEELKPEPEKPKEVPVITQEEVDKQITEKLKQEQDERRKFANEARAKKKEDNLNKILEFSKEKKVFTNDDVRDLLHVSQSTATNYLSELVKRGNLKREGQRGGTKYST